MLPYAAYLRVYEPLDAFAEPERSAWSAYADSEERPQRAGALDVEHARAMRRLIAVPPIVVPARESRDAYVRRAGGVTYVSPWETRLRSWLALDRLRGEMSDGLADLFVPRRIAEQAAAAFDRWRRCSGRLTPHILSSTWQVPIVWFVPFAAKERWLVLEQGESGGGGATTAAPARTLIYVTAMAQARRRLARALNVIRRHVDARFDVEEIESVGRWLEEFHPHSLVELDYGGLVHVMNDAALRADESVAEVAAAVTGLEAGETELAVAMYQRVVGRWRSVRALESAN